ncbi:MAG: DUF3549 family protein [Colwellia sp.]
METIDTISQLLKSSQSQYRVFDMGRMVTKISKEDFEKIENNQLPYPFPSQGHALLAISFWQTSGQQPYLWLLKLPLDEQGLLNQGARNHFIAIIVEALGKDLTQNPTEHQESLLKSNPYLFTPAQYKLASLNSKLKHSLKNSFSSASTKESDHLAPFITYLQSEKLNTQWQHIGVQGICDFVTLISQDSDDKNASGYSHLLVNSLDSLPEEVLSPLCSALENEKLSSELIKALLDKLIYKINNEPNDPINAQLLRSLASSAEHIYVKEFIESLLQSKQISQDLLIVISGRCWVTLSSVPLVLTYFEQLVKHKDSTLFNSIFRDVVAIPKMRTLVLKAIREPERSEALSLSIGQLFSS